MDVPARTSMLVREFLAKNNKPQSYLNHHIHQTWSPLTFFFFPKLRTPMKGKRFAAIEEIKEKSKQELLSIPKIMLQKYFENWNNRRLKCIIS